jgi:exodeoxyribonuclease VII small subunit
MPTAPAGWIKTTEQWLAADVSNGRNMATKKDQSPTFENAIERLESIVEQMESDSLPLEDLLVRYEEGLKLVKFCSEKLDAAEKRIEIIARDANGKPRLVEFEAKASAGMGMDSSAATADSSSLSTDRDSSEKESVRLF